jgi:hypothetical protein
MADNEKSEQKKTTRCRISYLAQENRNDRHKYQEPELRK